MLSCEQVLAELAGYLDEECARDLRLKLEAHLAECRTCRVVYDSTRKTLRIVTDARTFDLPEGLSERLVRRIMDGVRRE